MAQLGKITQLLEQQHVTLVNQSEQIGKLTREVDVLKEKVAGSEEVVVRKGLGVEELEEEGKRKDERIRKLELELEEARS